MLLADKYYVVDLIVRQRQWKKWFKRNPGTSRFELFLEV